MPTYQRLLLLLVAILLVSCSVSGLDEALTPSRESAQPTTPSPTPVPATVTPTPFLPIAPTPTYLPTGAFLPIVMYQPTPTPVSEAAKPKRVKKTKPQDFPGPSEYPTIPIPPPARRVKQPDELVNILVLGSDQPHSASLYRTDTILLLSLNPKKNTVNLVSFPRDLFVYIPGWTMQRINTAYAHGGFETLALTMEYNFGVRPDHYVIVNYNSFVKFINSLGGIDVNVEKTLTDNRGQRGWVTIPAGKTHMDGRDALWYVRSRYTTNDFDRNRRQQAVIRAVFKELLSIDAIAHAPDLYQAYAKSVTTDLRFKDFLTLLPFAATIRDMSQIHQYFIDNTLVTEWITPGGAMVLLPNQEAVLDRMQQALNSR
jgi:polyisoprenyl-teichoic acid--peptidoglycan teichoic acid transferase